MCVFIYEFLQALFLIATQGTPTLKNPEIWSPEFRSFLADALDVDTSRRASADDLLKVPQPKSRTETNVLLAPFYFESMFPLGTYATYSEGEFGTISTGS